MDSFGDCAAFGPLINHSVPITQTPLTEAACEAVETVSAAGASQQVAVITAAQRRRGRKPEAD